MEHHDHDSAKILIVEHNKLFSVDLYRQVKEFGYEVTNQVATGDEAIVAVEKTIPDLVLINVHLRMPMEGIETAHKIRFISDIPIVYLTTNENEDALERAGETQPYGYLLLPIDPKELHVTVEIALFKHSEEKKAKKLTKKVSAVNKSLKTVKAELIQAAKMTALSTLATGIAHEINNPLAIIDLLLESSLQDIEKGINSELKSNLTQAKLQVARIAKITWHFREFGDDKARSETGVMEVNKLIDNALLLIHEQVKKDEIQLNLELADNLPSFTCNALQMEQAIFHFLINAKEAIMVAKQQGKLDNRLTIRSLMQDTWIVVEVEDTGKGIQQSIQQVIFDPFFTTKKIEKNTGLGLFASHKIIQAHQGKVEFSSIEGEGATFRIKLPAVDLQKPATSWLDQELVHSPKRLDTSSNLSEDTAQSLIYQTLRSSRYFDHVTDSMLQKILTLAQFRTYHKGEILIMQNDTIEEVFFLIQGSVSVKMDGEFIYAFGRRGDIFGEVSVLTKEPSNSTVVANDKVEVITISANTLQQITDDPIHELHYIFYKWFSHVLSDKLKCTTTKVKRYEELHQHLEKDLRDARRTQHDLLLSQIASIPNFPLSLKCEFTNTLGGDLYGVRPLDENRYAILIGDVSGHGTTTSVVAVNILNMFHNSQAKELTLETIVGQIGDICQEIMSGFRPVTFFFGIYQVATKSLEFINAGHHAPLVVRDQKIIEFPPAQMASSSERPFADNALPSQSFHFQKGDRLLLFTDSAFEPLRSTAAKPYQLEDYLEQNASLSSQDLIEAVYQYTVSSLKNKHTDDYTLMVFEQL